MKSALLPGKHHSGKDFALPSTTDPGCPATRSQRCDSMAPGGAFRLCLIVSILARPAQSCFPRSIRAQVPVKIDPGYVVSQVPLDHCGDVGLHLFSSDPHFTVNTDGTIVVAVVSMVTKTRSFGVWVKAGRGQPQRVDVLLIPDSEQLQRYTLHAQSAPWNQAHKRFKRRWSPMPFNVIENALPPFPKEVDLIGSDSSVNFTVYYTIEGPGVTQPPMNVFSVDGDTGMVLVHRAVDREQYPKLVFQAKVADKFTGKETDRPLDITVLVLDLNDNPPTFLGPLEFQVVEQSRPDTEVGIVNATDRDEEGTPQTRIKFSLLTENQLFNIHPHSGKITTKSGTLDREVQATIPVTVEIRDMNGAESGLFNTATATITLLDVNDNPPTFKEKILKADIEENKADVLILRIPVEDRDEVNTQNWKANFVITQGNENNDFRMETDPTTNEGLLYVVKPLDYENGRLVALVVSARNPVPLVNSLTSWNSIPVEVSVSNVDEGPEFVPLNKVIRVRENTPIGTSIGAYTALDPETKSNTGIRYFKVSDPGSWLSVGEKTGELKVTNLIDLESDLVTNAMYNITVSAVDPSSKSGMGMVTLLIEDANDNIPELVDPVLVLCEEEGKRGWVTVVAHDADLRPYSTPYTFQLSGESTQKWRLRDAKNVSVVLEQAVDMPRGDQQVEMRIADLQDKGEVQVVTVKVCRCVGGQCVAPRSSAGMGAWGILALLLALAMLLLLCLLFVVVCNSRGEKMYIDDSSGGMLLHSNTEAPGEEVKSSTLLMIPTVDLTDSSAKGTGLLDQNQNVSAGDMSGMTQQTMGQQQVYQSSRRDFMSNSVHHQNSFYASGGQYRGGGHYSDSLHHKQVNHSVVNTWDTNKLYLDEKLDYFGGEAEVCHTLDSPHAYQYEGEGSAAGSVGCCSEMGDQDGLDFLDSLGPKFKTLANICISKESRE